MSYLKVCLVFLLFCSCKQVRQQATDEETVTLETIEDALIAPSFTVILTAKVLENDRFHVYFKGFDDRSFVTDNMITSLVVGKDVFQEISFVLKKDVLPIFFRIDCGINFDQQPIIFKSLKIRYLNKQYNFDKLEFAQLFRPNQYVNFVTNNGEILTSVIDGRYDPHFISINLAEIVFALREQ